jgi:hypothetical protein
MREEMTRTTIRTWLTETYPDEEFLLADGFEDAFVGVVAGKLREPVACYDREKCIAVLMTRDGMAEEEAEEFFAYNTEDAWVGEKTPVFLSRVNVIDVP